MTGVVIVKLMRWWKLVDDDDDDDEPGCYWLGRPLSECLRL